VAAHESEDSFAARYARERLAILDGDTDAIVELLGGELNAAHQFAVDAWELERDAARAALRRRDLGGLVDALLSDGDPELAWETAVANPDWDPGSHRWLRLAESHETQSPADALAVYWRVVDDVLQETDRRAYAAAVKILKRARTAAQTSR
jgi:hypothetical protein